MTWRQSDADRASLDFLAEAERVLGIDCGPVWAWAERTYPTLNVYPEGDLDAVLDRARRELTGEVDAKVLQYGVPVTMGAYCQMLRHQAGVA